jgi:hypothetical protein
VRNTAEQESEDIENPADRIVDLDDVYTETVKEDFETQQPDSDELTLENESTSSVTEETNSPITTSRTIQ